jgi:two-component system sensor histidine kinase YesM
MFGYFAYRENVHTAEENFTNVIAGNLRQTEGNVLSLFSDVEIQVNLFANNFIVMDSLAGSDSRPPVEQYEDYSNLQKVINSFEQPNKPFEIKLYMDRARMFLNDGTRYINRPGGYQENEFYKLSQRNYRIHWNAGKIPSRSQAAGDNSITFSAVSDIISFGGGGERLATVAFGFKESTLQKLLGNMDMSFIRNVYLIDNKGVLLTSIEGGALQAVSLTEEVKAEIFKSGEGSLVAPKAQKSALYVYRAITGYPYWLVAEIPTQEILNRSREILWNFVWISLLVISVSFLLAYLIAAGVARRIKKLVHAMGTVENNEFLVHVADDNDDEIGILSRKFNWMVDRIRRLIEDVYKSGLEKKEAEFNLLQAQINPHFLYNTLDSIHWLAVRHDVKDISYMIRNLSDFFRLSLNIERCVSIRTELRHLNAYFNIQEYRFESRIHLQLNVPPQIQEFITISLVLQPLVENALIHGILKDEGRSGTVTVSGEQIDDLIVLEVYDDGAGMDELRLSEVNEHILFNSGVGLGKGLRNVHQRIRVHFGEEYGLNIHSDLGKGTRCILIFPALLEGMQPPAMNEDNEE